MVHTQLGCCHNIWVRTLLAKVAKKGWSHYGHMTREELVTGSEKVSHFDFKIHRALVGTSGAATGYSGAIFSSQGQWVIDKILRSWGKLKQLLIQQLYELIKAAIPINLLAALKYLPFQPGDWEKGWESLGETLGPLGH